MAQESNLDALTIEASWSLANTVCLSYVGTDWWIIFISVFATRSSLDAG